MQEVNAMSMRKSTSATLDDIYPRLVRDFPASELKSRAQLERLMAGGHYALYLADHALRGVVGYAFVFHPPSQKIAWLDYIAIDPEHRNTGFGAQFMDVLCQHVVSDTLGMMMEVEPPTSDDPILQHTQQRRIAFYQSIGAKQLDVEYHFPTQAGPEPMLLFFRPIVKVDVLPKSQLQELIRAVYSHIHSDIQDHEARLGDFLDTIRDARLTE